MTNAKREFLKEINDNGGINNLQCVDIILNGAHILTTEFTEDEYDEFLKGLDVEYDSGYGSKNLYGYIWYKDGTWSSRSEYDGSEWWAFNIRPTIPEQVRRLDREREKKLNNILEDED